MRDLPLLATLLNAPTQETAYTARLGVAQRDNRRLELLARLLSAKADVAPTLVLLDNTQWMDEASWRLVARLTRTTAAGPAAAPRLLIIAALRTGHAHDVVQSGVPWCAP